MGRFAGDGLLAAAKPSKSGSDSYIFDPLDPIPTTGGASVHYFPDNVGVKDQRTVEQRKDVLVYTSPPLEQDLVLIGRPRTVIYVSSDACYTDIVAKLVDVRPDGYAAILQDGIRRGPDQAGAPKTAIMDSGKVYQFTVDLGPTAIRLAKGHRLRVEVSSSNFPKYTRNPNTGESPETATQFKKAAQQVLRSPEYPPHIVLPIIK